MNRSKYTPEICAIIIPVDANPNAGGLEDVVNMGKHMGFANSTQIQSIISDKEFFARTPN